MLIKATTKTALVKDIPLGSVVIVEVAAEFNHVYYPETHRMYREIVTVNTADYRDHFEVIQFLKEGEGPQYLHPYYVPGFAYHGHHLYLDDVWISHRRPAIFADVANRCGHPLTEFPYPQAFCKWFMNKYPSGCFLADLGK